MIIQPPNTPAFSGRMFGYTKEKNALEKGSSSIVGSNKETAPFNHSSGARRARMHASRTSSATAIKLLVNRTTTCCQSPPASIRCPAKRSKTVAANQIAKPTTRSLIFIT